MFFQKAKKFVLTFSTKLHQCSGPIFNQYRRKNWTYNLHCCNWNSNYWHSIRPKERGLFLKFNPDRKSKWAKIKKPCGRTTQFYAGLQCQARNQRRTELGGGWWGGGKEGCLAPSVHCRPLLAVFGVGYEHNHRVPSGARSETTAISCQVDNLPTSPKHLSFICC